MYSNRFLVFLVEIHFVCTNMFCSGNEIDSIVAYVNVYEFWKIESRHFNWLKFNRNRTNMFTNNPFHTNTMSLSHTLYFSLSLSHTHTHNLSLPRSEHTVTRKHWHNQKYRQPAYRQSSSHKKTYKGLTSKTSKG